MSDPVIPKYGRLYVRTNPAPNLGPDVLRLAVTDSLGGGLGPADYAFQAEEPLDVVTTPGTTQNVASSMDFMQLDSRTD